MDSILNSIKKLIGYEPDYTRYDTDLIIHINTALGTLTQLGVGSSSGFFITDSSATWDDFIGEIGNLESVKTYVYVKVKLVFDPPPTAAAIEALNKLANELEWRINNSAEDVVSSENYKDIMDELDSLKIRVDSHDELFRALVGYDEDDRLED